MNQQNLRKPIVLEKIQFESRQVFSINNRKTLIDERKNYRESIEEKFKNNSLYNRRIKLISDLPPHPKKIILPIIENQILFLSSVLLTLLHKNVVSNFQKSMIDFFILRSIFSVFVLLFLIMELYTLNTKINCSSKEKNNQSSQNDSNSLNLSKELIKLLTLWMIISSLITISQPIIERILTIQMISLCQLFTPLTSLIMFLLITCGFGKNKIKFKNTLNNINLKFLKVEKHEVVKLIKNESEKLSKDMKMIANNNITIRQLLVILLTFFSLFIGTPVKEIIIHTKSINPTKIMFCSILPALILPCLYDILFHLICNKIVQEFLNTNNNNLSYNLDDELQYTKRRISNTYIHLFMTLGQIFIVLPVCLIIKISIFSNSKDISLYTTNLKNFFNSFFEISNKEILITIFSSISMIGIYQRCKINNSEKYGITGLISVQGFQTLLSTSMKYKFSLWINNNIVGLLLSIFSIFLLKFKEIKSTIKIIYFYIKWIFYFKYEIKDKFDYISEKDYIKYYKSSIRVIGGNFDTNVNNSVEKNKLDKNLNSLEDDLSLKTDDETEDLIEKKNKDVISYENKINEMNAINNRKYINEQNNLKTIKTPIMSAKVVLLQNT